MAPEFEVHRRLRCNPALRRMSSSASEGTNKESTKAEARSAGSCRSLIECSDDEKDESKHGSTKPSSDPGTCS